jgi:hypothetical protein
MDLELIRIDHNGVRAVIVTTEVLFATIVLLVAQTSTSSYGTARAAAVRTCEAINPNEYQTGLAFNPDGYRSYYVRSECFQKTAVQFRDVTLCDRVRQRHALLSSSWGYSSGNCRTLVAQAVDADRRELEETRRQYLTGSMVLRDLRIERNGNGRDYDVIPSFAGANGHGYAIAIEILRPGGSPITVHADGYYVDPRSALRIFIRRQDIEARFPAFEPGRSYQVRAVAIFSLPANGGSRFLSDTFVERVFPLRERTQSVVRDVRF